MYSLQLVHQHIKFKYKEIAPLICRQFVALKLSSENGDIINQAEITTLNYAKRYACYCLRINEKELSEKSTTLKHLLLDANEKFG